MTVIFLSSCWRRGEAKRVKLTHGFGHVGPRFVTGGCWFDDLGHLAPLATLVLLVPLACWIPCTSCTTCVPGTFLNPIP